MKKHKLQPLGFEEGIYFNMPDSDYHADPAISRSGIVDLLLHPHVYWMGSSMNPDKIPFTSDAMEFGTQKHTLLLEPEKFAEKYRVTGVHGWDGTKKIAITYNRWMDIKTSVERIMDVPYTRQLFTNGYPEVSIFVREPESGLMMRIRVDYLLTFCAVDFKTIATLNPNKMGWAIADHGYDIQDQMYNSVLAIAKEKLRKGEIKVYGLDDDAWIKKFMAEDVTEFRFVYQLSTKPYIARVERMSADVKKNAAMCMIDALCKYDESIKAHGTEMWPACEDKTFERDLGDLPASVRYRGLNLD